MIKKINFSSQESLINYIQGLSIEVESRKELISFMLSNNMDTSTSQFTKYEKEYAHFYAEYSIAKQKLEQLIKTEFIQEDEILLSWNLIFETQELELTIKD